ncbi:WhiB family transcriptional regulator [Actinomadura keratinilytica]
MADFSRLPGPNADLWDWQLLAACRGVDSSLFFHPEGERGAARSARETSAKEVCMRCPVRAECAAHALAVREPYGVWGGLTEDEREELMGRARTRLTPAGAARRRVLPRPGPASPDLPEGTFRHAVARGQGPGAAGALPRGVRDSPALAERGRLGQLRRAPACGARPPPPPRPRHRPAVAAK